MNTHSSFGSHFLSIVLLTMMLAFMVFIAAAPFVQLDGLERTIDEQRALLVQLRQRATKAAQLSQQESRRVAPSQQERLLLAGDTMGIAGANLQKQVEDLILQNDGAVSSVQVLPPKADGDLMRIAIRVSFSIANDGLRDFLYELETRVPLNFVDEISVRTSDKQRSKAGPSSLGPLNVTMEISGFVMNGKAS